jgi:hypothetical protein
MPRTETIDKVPNAEVPRVKAEFEAAGATVVVTPNSDGKTSKIVATFP